MFDLLASFFSAAWAVTLELAPWLLLGAAVAGVLHVALPPDFVRRHLQGRFGVAKAVALGVPLPLCSCGVIPAGLGLRKDGASTGASVGFLISTPQTGVDSIFVSGSFLGWPFAIFKVCSAALMGLVGGALADRSEPATPSCPSSTPSPTSCSVPQAPRRDLATLLDHAVDLLRTIWRWLVFGIVASALITVAVPETWLTSIAGHGQLWALLAALVIALPLYVCATASVPIAAALVAGGFPPGAALVFLMAGPATNVATIGAVHRAFGRRALGVYLGTIVVGSVALGWLFDAVISTSAARAHTHVHGEASWWATASAVALVGLLGWFALGDLRSWWAARALARASSQERVITIGVDGLTCNGCVRKLQSALAGAAGVSAAEVSREPGRAVVQGTLDEARIRELIDQTGFTPV